MNSWRISTVLILATLILMFVLVGGLIGFVFGSVFSSPQWTYQCALFMFFISLLVAVYCYLSPVDPVLRGMNAVRVDEQSCPRLYYIVQKIAVAANTPMPIVYVCNVDYPNAFALGRSPDRALVAVTRPLMDLLDDNELEAVMGHELSHIIHRDTIVNGIARTSAKVLTTFAIVMGYAALVSAAVLGSAGASASNSRNNNGEGLAFLIMLIILIPVIIVGAILYVAVPGTSAILNFGVSRSREYGADESSARITKKPLALARALVKMENYCSQTDNTYKTKTTVAAPLMIVNPFGHARNKFMNRILSTHPSTESRIEKLRKISEELGEDERSSESYSEQSVSEKHSAMRTLSDSQNDTNFESTSYVDDVPTGLVSETKTRNCWHYFMWTVLIGFLVSFFISFFTYRDSITLFIILMILCIPGFMLAIYDKRKSVSDSTIVFFGITGIVGLALFSLVCVIESQEFVPLIVLIGLIATICARLSMKSGNPKK